MIARASLAPPAQTSRKDFSRVVTASALALAMTAPGQTVAVSVFVDPIIADLRISRSAVSAAYLTGTLVGAFVMPVLGRAIDHFGPRRVMAAIAVAFGAVLVASSVMSEIVGLTAAFVGIRVAGQGALTLVATTAVAVYVRHRAGLAVGLVSALGTAGISLAPVLLERVISSFGWRSVWLAEGLAVWLLVVPAALLLPRNPPPARAAGRPNRGARTHGSRATVLLEDWTLRQAVSTGMFWVVGGGVAACGLIATALNFHQVSLLGERGLSATEAAATFIPQTAAGLVASFGLGWLADRYSDRLLIILTMLVLALATVGASQLTPGWTAALYGIALGFCGNGVRTLEAVAFPKLFGVRHLGAIRGVVHAIAVGASAFGPVMLAEGRALSDTYRPVLIALAVIPLVIVAAAVTVRAPERPGRGPSRGRHR